MEHDQQITNRTNKKQGTYEFRTVLGGLKVVLVDGRAIAFKGFLIGCGITKGKEEKVRRHV